MVVCVECLPADKPWDVVSVTRRSSGVAPRACVRVYARVLVPPNLYIHTYIAYSICSIGGCYMLYSYYTIVLYTILGQILVFKHSFQTLGRGWGGAG